MMASAPVQLWDMRALGFSCRYAHSFAMFETARAKINLALHVRARLSNGYHAIETLFAFAHKGDRLSVAPSDDLTLMIDGPFAAGLSAGPDNLVLKAVHALRQASGTARGAALRLEKNLPIASGIGGGSADAAAALRLLTRHWRTDVPLDPIARALGADVPACLVSEPVRGEGVGEALAPVDARGLSGRPLLLINPGVPVPTGPVFAAWDGVDRGPLAYGDPLAAALAGRNDLQTAAISLCPAIGDLVAWLERRRGVTLARMSGSGGTCFAIFDTNDALRRADADAARDWPSYWRLATAIA